MRKLIILLSALIILCPLGEAKKIRNSFRIDKTEDSGKDVTKIGGVPFVLADTMYCSQGDHDSILISLKEVVFAGYDKEPNSSLESFILVNPSKHAITGYEVRIDYLDMQGRMLHSRTVKNSCMVPAGETRRFDLKSWDPQHTYYYYLGNEPKRVATPFKVAFYPLTIWIEE